MFRARVLAMGIEEVVTAPRSPWQNAFAERVIGSIRRECLDHVVVLNERHLRRILASYLAYYHRSRTHLSLGKDAPDGRPVQPSVPEDRRVPAGRRIASPLRTAGGLIRILCRALRRPAQIGETPICPARALIDRRSLPRRWSRTRRRGGNLCQMGFSGMIPPGQRPDGVFRNDRSG